MIIKTTKAIVDTNTFDSFYVEYSNYSREYRLVAVNRYSADNTVVLYTDDDKRVFEELLESIYRNLDNNVGKYDLGV